MSKVTIEDISRHTGLSRGTVSRALNDRPDISTRTKERVLEACKQLKYRPSHAARSLATGRSYAIAVAVDDLRSIFADAFLRGVLTQAARDHYAVHVTELGADPTAAIEQLCVIANERIDSVLLATALPEPEMRQLTAALESRPLVACAPINGVACDVYQPDYAEAGRLVGRHIFRAGGNDVLYVHADTSLGATERLAGFCEICREHQLVPERVTIEIHGEGPDRLAQVRDRLQNIRALAASDDFLAIELMLLSANLGRQPGRDIAVIGQGNEIAGARISPSLTTVDFCGEEIGRRAMDTAIQRIQKTRQDTPQHTHVTPQLIVRESSRTE